jgi:hypothetical protein
MTRADIRNDVRTNIEDTGTFWTDTELNRAIQECYNMYAVCTKCIEKQVNLNFTTDLVYYDFISLVPDFLQINGIFIPGLKRWLVGKSREYLDKACRGWEKTSGTPFYYCIVNHKRVGITPRFIASTTYSMVLHYSATAPILTDDTTSLIVLTESLPVFRYYAVYYAMLQAREFSKAKAALLNVRKEIKSTKQLMQKRGLPARHYTRSQNGPYSL